MASLRSRLDKAERHELNQGLSPHSMTASTFIGSALQIEQQQCVLFFTPRLRLHD